MYIIFEVKNVQILKQTICNKYNFGYMPENIVLFFNIIDQNSYFVATWKMLFPLLLIIFPSVWKDYLKIE